MSLEFWDKEISHNCKFCFECLSVVSMCLFFPPPPESCNLQVSLKDMDSWQTCLLVEQPFLQCLVLCLFFLWFIPSVQTPTHLRYCFTDSGCSWCFLLFQVIIALALDNLRMTEWDFYHYVQNLKCFFFWLHKKVQKDKENFNRQFALNVLQNYSFT